MPMNTMFKSLLLSLTLVFAMAACQTTKSKSCPASKACPANSRHCEMEKGKKSSQHKH